MTSRVCNITSTLAVDLTELLYVNWNDERKAFSFMMKSQPFVVTIELLKCSDADIEKLIHLWKTIKQL